MFVDKTSASILLVIAINLLAFCRTLCVAFDISEIEDCFSHAVKERRWKKKVGETFHLHYGDPALEIFNLLSSHQIKSIEYLADCTKQKYSSLHATFRDQTHDREDWNFGPGNVTNINGIFQRILPDVDTHVRLSTQRILNEMGWSEYDMQSLGIRSARVISHTANQRMKSQQELEQEKKTKEEWISLSGRRVIKGEDEEKDDKNADEFTMHLVKNENVSTITLVVQLNELREFLGASMLVKRGALSLDVDGQSESEIVDGSLDDGYEDEDHLPSVTRVPDGHELAPTPSRAFAGPSRSRKSNPETQKSKPKPQFNAMTTKYPRYVPERGNAIVLQREAQHGVMPLERGQRVVLVLEYWEFDDALAERGEWRPLLEEARPRPRREPAHVEL